jgi:ABC-2 type transport system permease protein
MVMHLGILFRTIFRRELTMMTRYVINTISGLVSIYLFFVLIFLGMQNLSGYMAGDALSGSLEGTIIGFFVWTFTIFAYSDLSWNLIGEAQAGTLEQLYLAPMGFKWVCACTVVSTFLLNLIPHTVFLLAMMATTGRWLHIDFLSLIPLMAITVLGAYGFGFALGGLALVFKRIQALFQIVQFVFLAFLLVPTRVPWAKFLPLSLGNSLLNDVMVKGTPLWRLPIKSVLMATAVGMVYLAVGLVVFARFEKIARDRGLLGHY